MGTIVTTDPATRFRQCDDTRIGLRVATPDLTIDWQPLVATKESWLGRLRGRIGQESTAEVVDLSVSGAKVAVVGTRLVPVGARVRIGLDGATGTVSVRRAAQDPGGRSTYGIQFLTLDPVLVRRIAGLLTGNRAHLEARWTTAR